MLDKALSILAILILLFIQDSTSLHAERLRSFRHQLGASGGFDSSHLEGNLTLTL